MPAPVFHEKPKSRKTSRDSTGETVTRNWFCMYTSDRSEVMELALANNPGVWEGLLRKSVELTPLHTDLWDVDVAYGVGKPDGLSPDTFSIRIGTASTHINQSRRTIFRRTPADSSTGLDLNVDGTDNTLVIPDGDTPVTSDIGKIIVIEAAPPDWIGGEYTITDVVDGKWKLNASPAAAGTAAGIWTLSLGAADPGSALNHDGAIGVTSDSVAGCDILVPKMEWSKTVQRPTLTFEYVTTLFNLVGKTNEESFYGFPAGSLLYLGAEPTTSRGQLADGTEFNIWTLTHQFAYERNRTNITIGDIIIPKKRGWEYLWVHFGKVPAARGMTQPPAAAYVEEVYESGNFELLEIGTGE